MVYHGDIFWGCIGLRGKLTYPVRKKHGVQVKKNMGEGTYIMGLFGRHAINNHQNRMGKFGCELFLDLNAKLSSYCINEYTRVFGCDPKILGIGKWQTHDIIEENEAPKWSMSEKIQCKRDTSSTAQGVGGSFKNRKPIGEVGCCESWMAE